MSRICLTPPTENLREPPQSGPLAQLVEQLTFNQWVAGSNPARLTTLTLNINHIRFACCECVLEKVPVEAAWKQL